MLNKLYLIKIFKTQIQYTQITLMKKYLFIGLALSCLFLNFIMMEKPELNQKIKSYCEQLPGEFDQIPEERQEKLKSLGDYILKKAEK